MPGSFREGLPGAFARHGAIRLPPARDARTRPKDHAKGDCARWSGCRASADPGPCAGVARPRGAGAAFGPLPGCAGRLRGGGPRQAGPVRTGLQACRPETISLQGPRGCHTGAAGADCRRHRPVATQLAESLERAGHDAGAADAYVRLVALALCPAAQPLAFRYTLLRQQDSNHRLLVAGAGQVLFLAMRGLIRFGVQTYQPFSLSMARDRPGQARRRVSGFAFCTRVCIRTIARSAGSARRRLRRRAAVRRGPGPHRHSRAGPANPRAHPAGAGAAAAARA